MSDSESYKKGTTGERSGNPTPRLGISAGGSALSNTPTYIATYTGSFDFAHADQSDIHPLDIAHALAQIPRFGGHAPVFYSVAQHCINVARTLDARGASREVVLRGLLHDAGEAYVGDMVTPLKQGFPGFSAVEDEVLTLIYSMANLPLDDEEADALVKQADKDNLIAEAQTLFDPSVYERYFSYLGTERPKDVPLILPVAWDYAEGMYLSHYKKLIRPRTTYGEIYDRRK